MVKEERKTSLFQFKGDSGQGSITSTINRNRIENKHHKHYQQEQDRKQASQALPIGTVWKTSITSTLSIGTGWKTSVTSAINRNRIENKRHKRYQQEQDRKQASQALSTGTG